MSNESIKFDKNTKHLQQEYEQALADLQKLTEEYNQVQTSYDAARGELDEYEQFIVTDPEIASRARLKLLRGYPMEAHT